MPILNQKTKRMKKHLHVLMIALLTGSMFLFSGCEDDDDNDDIIDIDFTDLTASDAVNGATPSLVLQFSEDITDLSATDITLTAGATGATKGNLTAKGSGKYELALTNITAGGDVTVGVAKSGYNITPATKDVTVVFIASIPLELVTANSMGTGASDLGSYLDIDANTVYKEADISASATTLNSLDLVFGSSNKISTPQYASGLSGIWSGISAYTGGAKLYPVHAAAWDTITYYADIEDYLEVDDEITEAVAVAKGDVFIILTTNEEYVLVKINDITTGVAPILSLKFKMKEK